MTTPSTVDDPRRRVVVTGIGLRSALGNSPAELAAALMDGAPRLRPTTIAVGAEHIEIAAGVVDECPEPDISPRGLRRHDRNTRLAVLAAQSAWADAGFARAPERRPRRLGVTWGVGFGGIATVSAQMATLLGKGPRRVSPFFVPAVIPNAAAGAISEQLQIHGPTITFATACAAGAHAVGEAFLRIRSGDLDAAIAGGSEAPLVDIAVAAFRNMRALAPAGSLAQPFGADRKGFVLAEGAAALVLERFDRARDRNVRIYGEIVGYGASADAHHPTDPDPVGAGAERAVRYALAQARTGADEIDYINAHATGTPAGDAAEAAMIARVLGDRAPHTWVSSLKGQGGHALGASGAIETAATLLALQSGLVPANVGGAPIDPSFHLRLAQQPVQTPLRVALKHAFGFGGVNAALVLAAADLVIND